MVTSVVLLHQRWKVRSGRVSFHNCLILFLEAL